MMQLKGTFGVELYENEQMVGSHRAPNTVVTQGLRQIGRWLSRQEFPDLSTPQTGNFRLTFGEHSQIYTVNNEFPYPGEWEYGITGSAHDYSTWTADRNLRGSSDTDSYITRFERPLDIISLGLIIRGNHDDNNNGATSRAGRDDRIYIRVNGHTVTGAGDTNYNGSYETRFEKYNSKYSYRKYGSNYHLFATASGTWRFSDSLGGAAAYETSDTPDRPHGGTWGLGSASGPVPNVTRGSGTNRPPLFPNSVDPSGNMYIYYNTTHGGSEKWKKFQWWMVDENYAVQNPSDANWYGKWQYQFLDFRAPYDTYADDDTNPDAETSHKNRMYGHLQEVEELVMYSQNQNSYNNWCYPYRIDIYQPNMHPQNPYALKLGTDDGTILPLASGNIALGAYSSGMEWKCSSVVQPSGQYKVRFIKELDPDDGNGITFKEIGLFGNLDGHFGKDMGEPTIDNADGLFARAIFDTPWSKTATQHAILYYEIEVS
jgi:hypothetical protein